MKKIITFCFLIAAGLTAQASPRTIMLGFTLNSPTNGQTLTAGGNFNEDVVITNLGPDNIGPTDTVLFADPTAQQGQFYFSVGYTKIVGDTIHMVTGLQTPTDGTDGTFNFCVDGLVVNGADITVDSIYGACNSITVTGSTSGGGSGVMKITKAGTTTALSFSPNPATNEININYTTNGNSAVVASVFDITGRLVYTYNYGSSKSNFKLDVSSLKPGLYMVEMAQDGNRSVGKMNKL